METRHYILLAAFAAMIVSSCEREQTCPAGQENTLCATLDCSAAATKAILVDNPGIRMESRWQGGDSIGVFGTGTSNLKFSVAATDILDNGKTANFKTTGNIPAGSLLAYSPYSPGASRSGQDIGLTFPGTQHYTMVNGVPAPDASASIMMGRGTSGSGILFRNAMAILKIGQVFDADTIVRRVEFRGLDNEAVSGAVTLSWNDGAPLATVTGTGKVITLDCGEGISFVKGQLGIFYIVVPARSYAKGFEITFVCQGGNVVRTAGTTKGKTLERSILYLIGDVSAREPLEGAVSQLKPNAILMTSANMDKIQIREAYNEYVRDENERIVEGPDGYSVRKPTFTMLVHKDLNPAVGSWMVFQDPTDDLPSGGVYKIKTCEKNNSGDWYEVVAKPDANPAAAFTSLTAGTEEEMLDLDITSYISSIVDEQGNSVPFRIGTKGQILLNEETVSDMLGIGTKAKMVNHTFSSPKLSFNRKDGNAEFAVGGSISLDTKLALGYMQGECQYAVLKVEPRVDVSLNAALKAEAHIEGSVRLYTINVIGIQVAPGVIVVPKIVLTAKAGVGGEIQVSGSVKLTQKLGSYSIAYNKGDGVTFRGGMDDSFGEPSVNMSFGGLEGSLYVYGGFGINTFLSFYGMAGLGLYNDFQLKFGTTVSSNGSMKLSLTPEYEATPAVTSLFGSKKFEDSTVKAEFSPLWERYILPAVKSQNLRIIFNTSAPTDIKVDTLETLSGINIPTSVAGIKYEVELEGNCIDDVDLVMVIYEGSGIHTEPDYSSDGEYARELAKYKEAGVEQFFDYYSYRKLEDPVVAVDTVKIATYPSGVESKKLEGTAHPYDFSSGVAYGVVLGVMSNGKLNTFGTTSRNKLNAFRYYWPNRSNGDPYFIPDTPAED